MKKIDYIAGIDIGKKGAVVYLDRTGTIFEMKICPPSSKEYADYISSFLHKLDFPKVKFYVEHVHAMPNNGVVSMFQFGKAFGEVCGILDALGQEYVLVRPVVWTKFIHFGYSNLEGSKKTSLAVCKNTFDIDKFYASKNCRVPHDGLIDAALIALYGYKKENE